MVSASKTDDTLRRGFTLTELLVVIGIMALLLAILLPAIQYTREAARKTTCRNNLRQIAIATHSYESAHGCFPPYLVVIESSEGLWWSSHVALLPHLEQQSLYERICREGSPIWLQWIKLPVFKCPSDEIQGLPASLSYARSLGTDQSIRRGTGVFVSGDFEQPIRLGDIRDGLSNTAAYAEILHGTVAGDDPRRPVWGIAEQPVAGHGDEYAELCRVMPPPTAGVLSDSRGAEWYGHSGGKSAYNHLLSPNTRSCAWNQRGTGSFGWRFGSFNAASEHTGGVYVALADASVRFVSNKIDLTVWRSAGTRAGGEAGPY